MLGSLARRVGAVVAARLLITIHVNLQCLMSSWLRFYGPDRPSRGLGASKVLLLRAMVGTSFFSHRLETGALGSGRPSNE